MSLAEGATQEPEREADPFGEVNTRLRQELRDVHDALQAEQAKRLPEETERIRAENEQLWLQMKDVGATLHSERAVLAQMRARETKRLTRFSVPEIVDRLNQSVDDFYEPEAWRSSIAKLEDECRMRPEDPQAHLMLAKARLLGTMQGADAWTRMYGLLHFAMDRRGAAEAMKEAFRLAPHDPEIQELYRRARQRATPPMLVAALPRSGSVFLYTSLSRGLRLAGYGGAIGGVFPDVTVCQDGLNRLMHFGASAHTHLSPTKTNLIEIGARYKLEHLLVHVRDPRQSMISFYHYLPGLMRDHPTQQLHYGVPADYLDLPVECQLDWHIDHWLRWSIDWICGWLDAPRYPWFETRILYTSFEEMVRDKHAFFDRVLAFYGIDRDLFEYPEDPVHKGDRNFFRGETEEWRRVLTPEQIERATARIPDRLFERFGWSRSTHSEPPA